MYNPTLRATEDNIDKGFLKINAISSDNSFPIKQAVIEIADSGNPDDILLKTETNNDGQTDELTLDAPPLEYSLEPSDNQPYSLYNIKISAEEYEETIISGVQILSGELER